MFCARGWRRNPGVAQPVLATALRSRNSGLFLTYTPRSAKQSASGLIRSNLKKRQLVIRYDYSNVPSLGGKRWISPSTQNITVFLLTTYNILQGRTLLTTAFAISLRFQRCFNAPVMFFVAVTGTSRCLGSAPGACP